MGPLIRGDPGEAGNEIVELLVEGRHVERKPPVEESGLEADFEGVRSFRLADHKVGADILRSANARRRAAIRPTISAIHGEIRAELISDRGRSSERMRF